MDLSLDELNSVETPVPFSIESIPIDYPHADELKLWEIPL